MSNALAIAAVTQTLQSLLKGALEAADLDALGQPDVTCSPPDKRPEGAEDNGLNLYLWKVTHNPALANECLPSHTASGARITSPRLGLDLHYMLTATGAADMTAPILLGYGMQTFHEHPVLSDEDISEGLKLTLPPAEAAALPEVEKILQRSDLAEQIERVRITPAKTEDEELTKLWPAVNAALRMTALYKVSLVLIEVERDIAPGPPVREYALTAFPMKRPNIARIVTQQGNADGPLLHEVQPQAGGRVVLLGSGFVADEMDLWLGAEQIDLTAPGVRVADQRISIEVPAALPAGLHLARIEHFWTAEVEPTRRIREVSTGGAFVLAPTVTNIDDDGGAVAGGVFDGPIAVALSNPIGEDQSARLFLTPTDDARPRRAFSATARDAPGTDLAFEADALAIGDYTYVLSVDGGETQAAPITIAGP